MPDWFYRTVSKPLLFRLPAPTARAAALGFMGGLARLPLGSAMIDFMGHMRPDARLQETHLGLTFATAIGLGPYLDGELQALPALARFGFGYLEIGPVFVEPHAPPVAVERRLQQEALWFAEPPASLGLTRLAPRIRAAATLGMPLLVRLGITPGGGPDKALGQCQELCRELARCVTAFALEIPDWAHAASPEQWRAFVEQVVGMLGSDGMPPPLLLCVPADFPEAALAALVSAALEAGCAGVVVDGTIRSEGGRIAGQPARLGALDMVRRLRALLGPARCILASGGVHEPGQALALREAGADLVSLDTGLVYTGPGLPKRINELLLFEKTAAQRARPPRQERPAEMTWFWTALMGLGMLLGSILALVIAAARVVMPYDETFLGMNRDQLHAINDRLLSFMAHDRVSLAGAMIAIGSAYLGLSFFGIRKGLYWAQRAVFLSAFTGFASFFLFLGFGYLDPFHAFVTAVLLQLLLLGVHSRLGSYVPAFQPDLQEDRAWRLSLWGQLLLIIHGAGLLGAGVVISSIGVTRVFVPEDLEFMRTTAEALRQADAKLVPLVAHDRATLGGMLLAGGLLFLLFPLWGFRRASAGLWWTFLGAGLAAYAAAIGVHYVVGYTDLGHLLPAFAGLALLLSGLGLSYLYLCDSR